MKKKINANGFTLIEVLVALTLFGLIAVGIALMQLTSIRNSSLANTGTLTTAIAQGALEDILALPLTDPFFSINRVDEPYDLSPGDPGDTLILGGGGEYSALISVQRNVTIPVYTITVEVEGPRQSVTLTGFKGAL